MIKAWGWGHLRGAIIKRKAIEGIQQLPIKLGSNVMEVSYIDYGKGVIRIT